MSSHRIRMRHLRCFLAVARLGSVTRAADVLGTVQPSVSRSIREFEEEMGCSLFDRTPTGLALNTAGRTLFNYVSAGLGQLDRGIEVMRGQMTEKLVTAFVLPNVVRFIMPGAVRRFKSLYPDVDVRLESIAAGDQRGRLRDGEVDFGFGRLMSARAMEGLNYEHLFSEPLVFCGRAGHPLANRDELSAQDIDQYQVILPTPKTIIREEFDRFIISQGISRFTNTIETVSFEFARNYARTSDAVLFQPLGTMRGELANGTMVRLNFGQGHLMGSVGITTHAGKTLRAPAQLLVQCIHDEVKEQGLE